MANIFNLQNIGSYLLILSAFQSLSLQQTMQVDTDCNFYQDMASDVMYYVYNEEYPHFYKPSETCRWILLAPEGYKIDAFCQIEIPQSSQCLQDRLMVSLDGNENLENSEIFCGYGNTSLAARNNKISFGLITSDSTKGGRFLCTVKATMSSCNCGWKNLHRRKRIVGGSETYANEYPMMAGLIDTRIHEIFCGATIIAKYYALTAAHCLEGLESRNIYLLVGDHDITTGSETSASRLFAIAQFEIHENYDPYETQPTNDIALVRTATEIVFTQEVGPACLPFKYRNDAFTGDIVTALGWGTMEFTGPKSEVLLKTELDVLSPSECAQKMNGTSTVMCTYRQGHDACQSDSGGPLMYSNVREYVVGTISYGIGCASKTPAVNTRITSFLNWIVEHTPGVTYCVK